MANYLGNNTLWTFDTTNIQVNTPSFTKELNGLSYSANQTYVVSGVSYSSSSVSYAVNGTESFTWSTTLAPAPAFQTALLLGGQSTVYFTGTIMEVIMYDAFFTNLQRQQVEGYLAWKWGTAGLLPANHPDQTFPP